MFSTPQFSAVFDPQEVAALAEAIHRARALRPEADVQAIAQRVVAAASAGETNIDALAHAGAGDD